MIKAYISNTLRRFKLLYFTDIVRYRVQKFKNREINATFLKNNPGVKLPPDYLMYESFQINYHKYYIESKKTAEWLFGYIKKHKELKDLKILDWGCGPGRIIRQLPEVVGNGCSYYGTDYNKGSIDWCKANLPGIEFNHNGIEAKLPYADHSFDVIYGISIFTHLSEKMHHDWYKELYRVLKPDGVMFLTTHGNNFKVKLSAQEIAKFDQGQLIVRGQAKEGHRIYTAFQPPLFMQKLFSNVRILEHVELAPEKGKWLPQDIWIVKKV